VSQITTHVLDTALGKPASDIPVRLEFSEGESWKSVAQGQTNSDGRVPDLLPKNSKLHAGTYRITFDLQTYFATQKRKSFYPYASIVFQIEDASQHFHVPLLLSGFGYSTYRGS
jgi:5-hydroxyisourate hydrolase